MTMDVADDGMAAIIAANPVEPAPVTVVEDEPEDQPGDEPDTDDTDVNDEAEQDDEQPEKRKRQKPADRRIAEELAKRKAAERERDALAARIAELERGPATAPEVGEPPAKPDPSQFTYGDSDPEYIDKLTDWKLDMRDHQARLQQAENAKASAEEEKTQALIQQVQTNLARVESEATAKYPDFEQKLQEAVEARGGNPLPPILTVGVSVSPVGSDVLYRMATDKAVSEKLERLANGGETTSRALARAFGEIEAEYLADDNDEDLDLSDHLDMARLVGRMNARIKGVKAPARVTPTNAPEPPAHRVRGSGGRYEVSGDTNDFLAFERKANGR